MTQEEFKKKIVNTKCYVETRQKKQKLIKILDNLGIVRDGDCTMPFVYFRTNDDGVVTSKWCGWSIFADILLEEIGIDWLLEVLIDMNTYIPYTSSEEFIREFGEHGPFLCYKKGEYSKTYFSIRVVHSYGEGVTINTSMAGNGYKELDYSELLGDYQWMDGATCGVYINPQDALTEVCTHISANDNED